MKDYMKNMPYKDSWGTNAKQKLKTFAYMTPIFVGVSVGADAGYGALEGSLDFEYLSQNINNTVARGVALTLGPVVVMEAAQRIHKRSFLKKYGV